MEWYLKVVKDNYANFNGRARRQEYWMFTLINFLILVILSIICFSMSQALDMPGLTLIYIIYALGVFLPSLAVAIRRLHDQGKSGWFYLVGLIPFIGGIWLIILLATEGDRGPNEYGADPKGNNDLEINEIGTSTH